ncbi:hypothetical protein [Alterisphingorhabdus coralli]|uniref:Uncharacterized protein n=1 Tax=Alterisphingorhabdus coralli TaxID=3071408 RepID=A0AA97F6G1_9SPHN|nr:hypothetical protein [Parasphingorhabdus sp. SCSIO 66989]WOE74137.1 hypothetical protein RB602_09750 [Parasphingorhabdus sp. SCSIO 66989]
MRIGRLLGIVAVLLVALGVVGYINGGEQAMSRIEVPLEPKAPEPPEPEDYSE